MASSAGETSPTAKAEWGNATWYLLHTLPYKLKDEYANNRTVILELFDMFYQIAVNLPCPMCSQHAQETFRKLNRHNLVDKASLIRAMWEYHNIVNKQLKKPTMTMEEMEAKYKTAVTRRVVEHFTYVFSKKTSTERAMLYSFGRRRVIDAFLKYMKSNSGKFDA